MSIKWIRGNAAWYVVAWRLFWLPLLAIGVAIVAIAIYITYGPRNFMGMKIVIEDTK